MYTKKETKEPGKRGGKFIRLHKLFPSMITILALCLGITALHYAIDGKFESATMMIVLACILDGLDGRVARFFRSVSDFGAHLDTLSDVISFGVSPGIIVYLWILHSATNGFGWAAVLIYVTCAALRLARFNVQNIPAPQHSATTQDDSAHKHKLKAEKMMLAFRKNFSVGLPMPIAAIASLLPIMLSFKLTENLPLNPSTVAIYLIFIGILMVSKIPIFLGKYLRITAKQIPAAICLGWVFMFCVAVQPWIALPALTILYLFTIPMHSAFFYLKLKELKKSHIAEN